MSRRPRTRRRAYYDPGSSSMPRKADDAGTAKIAKETRQLRRARQRAGEVDPEIARLHDKR